MMMKNGLLPLMAALMIVTASCSSSRKAAQGVPGTAATTSAAVVTGKGHKVDNKEINALMTTYGADWQDFQAPVNIALESPKSMSLSGRLTMVNGTGFTLSVRVLGFEAAAVTVVGDSIFAYEKLHKRAVAEDVGRIASSLDLSTTDLAALLLGHLVLPGGDYTCDKKGSQITLSPAVPLGNVNFGWLVNVDAAGNAVPELCVVDMGGKGGVLNYSDYVTTPAGPAAKVIGLQVTAGKIGVAGSLTMTYDKAQWNKGAKISRPTLRGYSMVKAADLLNIFKSL